MYTHQAVMQAEVLEGLRIIPEGIYIDATLGRGGHSTGILGQLSASGKLLAIDKDPQAIEWGLKFLRDDPRFAVEHGSFAMLKQITDKHGVTGKVNGILLDLGVSSPQLDDPRRGFSFLRDGPLDMRMDPTSGISAASWLSIAKETEIREVLKEYGEERYAKRIAAAIVHARATKPIETTAELAEIVAKANPAWEHTKHPATRSFQGIRIFINNELTELEHCLEQCLAVLAIGGRLVVLSFHSLEDRIVKRFMKKHARGEDYPAYIPIQQAQLNQQLKIMGRPIKASEAEVSQNPRARSAMLRITEKIR